MRVFKIKLFVALLIVGLIGVVSLLFSSNLLAALPADVTDVISPDVLRFLILVNPALFTLTAVTAGVLLYDKANFSVPILEKLLKKPNYASFSLRSIVSCGIAGGLAAGVFLFVIATLSQPFLPAELTTSNAIDRSIFTRLLYGGVTEELLMRFGVMTLITWVIFKITKKLTTPVYWTAIIASSVLFALGHLPIVFAAIAEPTMATLLYIIFANSVGGLIFGYVYYRKGLESAFIAHIFAHVTMIALSAVVLSFA